MDTSQSHEESTPDPEERQVKRVKEGRKVMMGEITLNTYAGEENRLNLWDGDFKTGYRVVEFRIIPRHPTADEEVVAQLTTKARTSVPSIFNYSHKSVVAYAGWNIPTQTQFSDWNQIVEGNMAIQDLWISCYGTGDDTFCNYYIVLEKYTFPNWDGTAIIAENNL